MALNKNLLFLFNISDNNRLYFTFKQKFKIFYSKPKKNVAIWLMPKKCGQLVEKKTFFFINLHNYF